MKMTIGGRGNKMRLTLTAMLLCLSAAIQALAASLFNLAPASPRNFGLAPGPAAPSSKVYSTNFPLTENPISEGGLWLNGQADGIDWLNIRTQGGVAYGTRDGGGGADFTDPTAILKGAWGPNQTAEAVVVINVGGSSREIELRLNSTLSAKRCTGYEILFEVAGTITVVRWDGAIGNFALLTPGKNLGRPIVTGDVLKATHANGLITVYFNGTQVEQVADATHTGGAPGFGLNNYAPAATNPTDFGFTRFTATD